MTSYWFLSFNKVGGPDHMKYEYEEQFPCGWFFFNRPSEEQLSTFRNENYTSTWIWFLEFWAFVYYSSNLIFLSNPSDRSRDAIETHWHIIINWCLNFMLAKINTIFYLDIWMCENVSLDVNVYDYLSCSSRLGSSWI